MRRNSLMKLMAFVMVLSMMFAGCSRIGLDMDTGNIDSTVTEKENGAPALQSFAYTYENVGGIIGVKKVLNYHPIPNICKWDAASRAFVAPDNGTNENGESIVIKIACKDIDKSESYADNLARIEGMLNDNKDKHSASGLSYTGGAGHEVIAYYYATETIENRDGKEYVHIVAEFELLRYKREQCIDPYTANTYTIDVVKPVGVETESTYKYLEEFFDSVKMGYTEGK